MYKKLLLILSLAIFAVGCEPQYYNKTTGEVVDKTIINGRFGNVYYLDISYSVGKSETYAIDDISVEKEEFDKYKEKDRVVIFYNDDGIGEIMNEEKVDSGKGEIKKKD